MPPAPAFQLFPLKAHQDEVLGAQHLAQANAVAFEPETAPIWVAQGHMAQRHVAMPFHLQDAAGLGQLQQKFFCVGHH